MSVSAKGAGGNKASDIIPYVLKPFSLEQLFNGFFLQLVRSVHSFN